MKYKGFINQLNDCKLSKFYTLKLLQLIMLTVNTVLRYMAVNAVYDIFKRVRKIAKSDY